VSPLRTETVARVLAALIDQDHSVARPLAAQPICLDDIFNNDMRYGNRGASVAKTLGDVNEVPGALNTGDAAVATPILVDHP
jgi:hypothetical protein